MEKKEKIEKTEEIKKEKAIKPLVTCRVLFISVLDKIYLAILLLLLVVSTISNFRGDISSMSYGFWGRVGKEILILIGLFILYLFLNWLYRCAVRTVLCLTENQVYKEHYVPFKEGKVTIPLNKITAVSTLNVLWIFRSVTIHQYGRLPMIFFTWNNKEFKDKLTELITSDKDKVENIYDDKNIIPKDKYNYLMYLGIALVGIIALVGVVRLFGYITSPERKMAGTYSYKTDNIILNKDGSCDINDVVDKVTECEWSYDKDDKKVTIDYKYESSYWYSSYTYENSIKLDYDSKEKSIEYNSNVYKK